MMEQYNWYKHAIKTLARKYIQQYEKHMIGVRRSRHESNDRGKS